MTCLLPLVRVLPPPLPPPPPLLLLLLPVTTHDKRGVPATGAGLGEALAAEVSQGLTPPDTGQDAQGLGTELEY